MPKTPLDYEPVTPSRRGRPAGSDASAPGRSGAGRGGPGSGDASSEDGGGAAPVSGARRTANAVGWKLKRGHALSYVGLVLFTIVLYFRPQEYYAALASVQVALIAAVLTLLVFVPTQFALEGTLTARPREVNLLLLLSVMALLSVPFAVSPSDALNTFWDPFLKAVIVFILIVNVVRTERRLRGMFYLALAVTCTLCFMALNDYRLGNLSVEGYRIKGAIKGGMFENTNDLGIHLVTMFPLTLTLGLGARRLPGKLFYWAFATLILATLVITFSRGGFLGLLAVVVVLAWKLARGRKGAVTVSLVLAGLAFVVLAPASYWTRIASIFDASLDLHASSSMRSALLQQSFLVALRHPLFGIGMGNFSLVSIRSLVSHNSYTQVAAEMGLVALLLYTMFIVAPLRHLREIERETLAAPGQSRSYYLAVGLQASLVGFLISSFFVAVAYYWFIYYLVGYAVCFRRIYRDAQARGKSRGGVGAAERRGEVEAIGGVTVPGLGAAH